jgi:hypothetical protein
VIVIIVLIAGRHKDKYGPGNLGATGKGCCSLANQSVCSQGNYYDKAAGCNVKGVSTPGYEAAQVPGGCICNGQGVCAKTGTDSGTCTCQFTNSDGNSPTDRVGTANGLTSADACQQCPAGTVVSNACQDGKGIPCAEWNSNGAYTCSGSGYTSPCTITSATNIKINTACEEPPPVTIYWCYQSYTLAGLERNLQGPFSSMAAAEAAMTKYHAVPGTTKTWDTLAKAQAACVLGGGNDGECESNTRSDEWCKACEILFGDCNTRCDDFSRAAQYNGECSTQGDMHNLNGGGCVASDYTGYCPLGACTCFPTTNYYQGP